MAEDQGAERKEAEGEAPAPTGAASADEAAPTPADTPGEAAADAKAEADAQDVPSKGEPETAAAEAKAEAGADPEAAREAKPVATPAPARRRASKLWWALPILMLVEFYVYGHNGRLEICVGKEGDTDFSLVGQERTDANRWKFPRCETRENLGLRSHRDERVKEGIEAACRGATIFRHQGESKACVAGEQGWEHRVDGHFVPPWDPAYYRHLFWFLQ